MKKLIVIALVFAMLLTVSAVAMGSIGLTKGSYTLTYDWKAKTDKHEIDFYIEGKMNDEVSYTLRYMLDDKTACGTASIYVPWVREAFINLKKPYGKFMFGLWEIKSYSALQGYFENDSALFGRLKSPFAIGYTSNTFFDYFTFSAVYLRDKATERQWDNREAYNSGTYMLTLAFKGSRVSADYNYFNFAEASYTGNATTYAEEMGYTFNITAKLTDWLSVGFYTGLNQQAAQEMKAMIANVAFKWGKWNGSFSKDFEDGADAFGAGTVAPYPVDTDPRWGWALQYSFSNALALEYRLRDQLSSTGGQSDKAELRLKLSFK